MYMKEKTYMTPFITEVEMIVEQTVLAASGGEYPALTLEACDERGL